jgi:hypothetical protein
VEHVTETSFSAFPLEFFPENTGAVSDEHVKNSISIFPKLKGGTVENGVQIYRLTAAGIIRETSTGEYK